MGQIPTAAEFAWNQEDDFKETLAEANYQNVYALMIEFAKLHVEAALKAAASDAHTKDVPYTDDVEVDKESILTAYTLENIN